MTPHPPQAVPLPLKGKAIKKKGDNIMIFKKKEVIAASLVVMIGLAGYLNWSYQDTVKVRDNDSYVATGKMLGEAEMVSSTNENTEKKDTAKEKKDTAADFEDARQNRESARAAAMEALKATTQDETVDEGTRTLAGEKLVKCAENIELENTCESIAEAKGFPDTCVYINEDAAVVTVKTDGLDQTKAQSLCEIVTQTANVSMDKIKIVEVR